MLVNAIDNCSDSTFFIQAKAQDLFSRYVDSVKGTFDQRYLEKCMQAYKYEKFTVTHKVSEYHYTLYYYDQAGNLVKTIAPAGVRPNYDSLWLDTVAAARQLGQVKVPAHIMPTQYRYNTLNQVTAQKSPDSGRTDFWYDRLGRLALSRNARQLVMSNSSNKYYSYTKYDVLGRITEVGQLRDAEGQLVNDTFTRSETLLQDWHNDQLANREQITNTIYDIPYSGFAGADPTLVVAQANVRNRVSYVTYADNPGMTSSYNHASFYSYDIHGNVDTLLQDYGQSATRPNIMNKNANRWKKIVYEYDLISGKVNKVLYQPRYSDQFTHRYLYDAENRLTEVYTSLDGFTWEREAKYEYYLHGPLARTTIGQQQSLSRLGGMQGMDYAYTLQGWLKGVNSTGATATHDIGADGQLNSLNQYIARDALGFNLNYFQGDYQSINPGVNPFPAYRLGSGGLPDSMYRPLYNGNISSMATWFRKFEGAEAGLLNVYKYDQLNRLVKQDVYKGFNAVTNSYAALTSSVKFREQVRYDANGNILNYLRNGNADSDPTMDDMTYQYYPGSNRLKRIDDKVSATRFGSNSWENIVDIDGHLDSSNYVYDSIGNLIQDKAEKITNIQWNVYGKITEITRNSLTTDRVTTTRTRYTYDAQGNRISKVTKYYNKDSAKYKLDYTWYVRDAQGNLLSTYTVDKADTSVADLGTLALKQADVQLYGSSRLGNLPPRNSVVDQAGNTGPWINPDYRGTTFYRGDRQYELTNHLGNVLTTISDRKIPVYSGSSLNLPGGFTVPIADYFEPDMVSATDYYPFGMVSRDISPTNNKYRFGFNGKENDNEVKGFGNQVDYGGRIYDSRIGKFLSIDPMSRSYPGESNYSYAGNSPIMFTDFNGYFKISPFFAKRYPTLARVLQYYLPLLKDNPQIKAAWIRTVGFSNQAEGEKAFDEMVTYGQGPWITPTRELKELNDPSNTLLASSRFYEPNSYEGGWAELPTDYVNNLAISHYRIDDLEAALKKGDANEIGRTMFIVSSIIMHEATHWGKWKYNCCEVDDSRYEKGSVFEFEAFGQRFTNKFGYKSPFDDKLAKSYYDQEKGGYGSPSFGLSINILNGKHNYWRMIKVGNLLPGQIGDPTIRDNKDKEELPKPYQQKDRKSSGKKDKFTY